jgi:hypothetical protein
MKIEEMADAVVRGAQDFVGRALAPMQKALEALGAGLASLQAQVDGFQAKFLDGSLRGADGAPGVAGKDGVPGEHGEAGPAGERGERGLTGEPGGVGERGEKGDSGERGADGAPGPQGEKGDRGEPGPAGERGERGEKGDPGERGESGLSGEKGMDGRDGRDGNDGAAGRDALQIDVLPAINAERSYSRGTWASHDGGLWVARRTTVGMDGWECVVDGLAGLVIEQNGEREFVVRATTAAGRNFERRCALPVLIYRGVFKEGADYQQGDTVTWGGNLWHCDVPTSEKPQPTGPKLWSLAAQRGRDGKSA